MKLFLIEPPVFVSECPLRKVTAKATEKRFLPPNLQPVFNSQLSCSFLEWLPTSRIWLAKRKWGNPKTNGLTASIHWKVPQHSPAKNWKKLPSDRSDINIYSISGVWTGKIHVQICYKYLYPSIVPNKDWLPILNPHTWVMFKTSLKHNNFQKPNSFIHEIPVFCSSFTHEILVSCCPQHSWRNKQNRCDDSHHVSITGELWWLWASQS